MKPQLLYDAGSFNVSQYRDYKYFHHWSGMSIAVLPILNDNCSVMKPDSADAMALFEVLSTHATDSTFTDRIMLREALYGFRKEDMPCWQVTYEGDDQLHWTCTTGGVDPLETRIVDAMLRELAEEMGIVPENCQMIQSQPMFTSKGTNLQVVHFVLNIDFVRLVDRKPDSEFEANSERHWLTTDEVRLVETFDLHSNHLLRMASFNV